MPSPVPPKSLSEALQAQLPRIRTYRYANLATIMDGGRDA